MQKLNKETRTLTGILLPLVTMMLWGSLFPFIKLGYTAFNIDTESVADILMFAALRFTVCGLIVCVIAFFSKSDIAKPHIHSVLHICVVGIFAIALHYGFTYVGLSRTDSSKTAILKQLAPLVYTCFSFLFVKEEKFSVTKIIGAAVGFCGILAINCGNALHGFRLGDILIILASLCTVVSMIISGKSAKGTSPLWITGISQLFGGAVLLIVSWILGGKMPLFTLKSSMVFAYICTASILGYTLFYYVQRTTALSKLFIIKFAEPLFSCLFGAILLGENIFQYPYAIAFVLIAAGIVLGNAKGKAEH